MKKKKKKKKNEKKKQIKNERKPKATLKRDENLYKARVRH